ncbi:aspartate/glutamate racemase family protein [Nocardiopsis alba]|uniref:Aspartate/glutamate racemase family protein n=2 Tax=Nocardiopsis alba TaxID=53437 RepID=A0ABV5DVQ1_9ACTN|nr:MULTISPECIES: aspartate/glutamate racemase family protein [Nocardiopsis]AFR08545.1 putative hydantoin racemase [Nocardiopsis alba ATCC BAA-2165]MEC3893636.1 aspartate/glutamate racemase family protein [Nocardiopsis sp. LDBS1602]
MRILLVNVNTSEAVTEALGSQARAVARPGTEIEALTPRFGPESVEGNFESHLSAVAVMDRVATYEHPYDAVVQAGFGEHGKEGLQELCSVPVVDITEAAAHVAVMIGDRYSVVTSLRRTVPQIEARLAQAGLDSRCASIRASGLGVLELEADRDAAVRTVAAQARAAVEEDGAETVVLGCGGMAGLDEAVREACGVPVVDGVAAAVALAESLVGLGLTTSKISTFAAPRPKTVTHWPLSTALGL